MKPQTRTHIRQILYDFAMAQLPKLGKWIGSDIKLAYPFHSLLLSDERIVGARVERSIVTSMGSVLYPALAKAVAEDRYSQVYTEYDIDGVVNDAACNMIEQIVTELRTAKRRRTQAREPNHEAELSDILSSRGGGQSARTVRADLYIEDFTGGPLFVELKTPLPNLDVAAESKKKMLYFLLIMARKSIVGPQSYLGLTYNPFLTRNNYSHNFTERIMDMNAEVLIGEEMWDFIGGAGTYSELLEIIRNVRQQLPNLT